jgi:hypothetical protein
MRPSTAFTSRFERKVERDESSIAALLMGSMTGPRIASDDWQTEIRLGSDEL